MLKSKNIILYEILAVLGLFTIVYFSLAVKASHAFEYDSKTEAYNNKINLIQMMSEKYAENNLDLFEKKENIYITVSDLVKNNYFSPDDEDGNVFDPTSEIRTLNDLKIRLTYKDEVVTSKIIKK